MIFASENLASPFASPEVLSDIQTERLLLLCDRIGAMAEQARTVLMQHQTAAGLRPVAVERDMLHLQARLETITSRLQGTQPLLDAIAA